MALLTEGDPLFYGSFMYMHDRLSTRFDTEIIPGVPAFSAATAVLGMPLVRQTDVLTVLPGTLGEHELAMRLADTDGAIIMKLGRTFAAVYRALVAAAVSSTPTTWSGPVIRSSAGCRWPPWPRPTMCPICR